MLSDFLSFFLGSKRFNVLKEWMLQRHFFKKSLEDGFLKDSLKTKRTCEKTNICLFKLWHFERKLELKIYFDIFHTPDCCGAVSEKLVLFNRFWKPRPGGADSSGEETFMDSISDWEHLLLLFFRQILSDIIIRWLKYESGATVPWTAGVLLLMH